MPLMLWYQFFTPESFFLNLDLYHIHCFVYLYTYSVFWHQVPVQMSRCFDNKHWIWNSVHDPVGCPEFYQPDLIIMIDGSLVDQSSLLPFNPSWSQQTSTTHFPRGFRFVVPWLKLHTLPLLKAPEESVTRCEWWCSIYGYWHCAPRFLSTNLWVETRCWVDFSISQTRVQGITQGK